MTTRQLPISLALAIAGVCAPLVRAANFGNFEGDTVIYEDVLENSDGLFMAPMISGDTLDFTNAISLSDFEADAQSGASDSVVGQLNAFIQARPGREIRSFEIEISGQSEFAAFGLATDATSTSAVLRVTPRILEVGGFAIPGGSLILTPTVATLAEFDIVTDGQGSRLIYSGTTQVSIADAAQAQYGITDPITRILWSIDLTLEAESEVFSRSIINLRALDNLTVTVPEPTSLALLGLAAGLAGLRRRRR